MSAKLREVLTHKTFIQALLDGKTLERLDGKARISLADPSSLDAYLPYPSSWQVADIKDPAPVPEPRPNLVDPRIVQRHPRDPKTSKPLMINTHGNFKTKNGYPLGLILHFTAGHNDTLNHAENMTDNLFARGLGVHFSISMDGTIFQNCALNQVLYHCGDSFHPVHGHALSDYYCGVEVCNGGQLVNDKTWFGKRVELGNIREIKVPRYTGEQVGKYEVYSSSQEYAIDYLVKLLKANDPITFKEFAGHDEIACTYKVKGDRTTIVRNSDGSARRGRKNDPGGAHSEGMAALRLKHGLKI